MITRRQITHLMIGVCTVLPAHALSHTDDDDVAVTEFRRWMDASNQIPKTADGSLQVGRFADYFWYTLSPLQWSPNINDKLPAVTVPRGFITDFASIPRLLWSKLPRDGDYVWAAVVHDYLYWTQGTTREQADQILNAAMIDLKIPVFDRLAIYSAVRVAGQSAWDQNSTLRASGQRRLIKAFPTNPTISWKDWQRREEVFN